MLQAQRKMSRADERRVFEGQYISMQPSLYGDHVEVKGRLGALEADICRQGLDRRGERIVPSGEAHPDPGQRRALALTTLCQDELDRTPEPAKTTAERIREARRTPEPTKTTVPIPETASTPEPAETTTDRGPETPSTPEPAETTADRVREAPSTPEPANPTTEPAEATADRVREAPGTPEPAEATTEPIRETPGTPEPAKTTAQRFREARRRRREPVLMIVANQALAEPSGNEQGVAMLAGARVGPDTVDLVQCVGTTEVITVAGQSILQHGTTTSMRPSLRRAVLARDDGCTIDGCTSTYRLEAHHIVPRSQGGTPHRREPHHPLLVPPPRRRPPPRHAHRPPIATPTATAAATEGGLRLPGPRARSIHTRHPQSPTHPRQPRPTLTVELPQAATVSQITDRVLARFPVSRSPSVIGGRVPLHG